MIQQFVYAKTIYLCSHMNTMATLYMKMMNSIQNFSYHQTNQNTLQSNKMNKKYAICTLINNMSRPLSLVFSTVRQFDKNIDIYGLYTGDDVINTTIQNICEQFNVKIINANKLFDEYFFVFNLLNCYTCKLPHVDKIYPHHIFGRFLIPFVDQLKQYDKVLYMDNDCIVLKPLDELFNEIKQNYTMLLMYDGQTINEPFEKIAYKKIKKFDKLNCMNNYYCDGSIMFDNTFS